MRKHRNPRTQVHISGIRLISQELYRVKRGLVRYTTRASALAHDIAPGSARGRQIRTAELSMLKALKKLEAKVSHVG